MNNFEYYNPVKVVFGKGTIAQVADLIEAKKKVMMTFGGGSIKKNGVYDQVVKAFGKRKFVEFGGIEPNPRYETCLKAVALAKKKKVDFLLSVGGGSVLDATKFIAAAIRFRGKDPWDILTTVGGCVKAAVPLGAILTLPATGSEMNGSSVISREKTQEKLFFVSPKVFPQFSILDPETTYSLPKSQVRNGIVDAFVHVMEQYMTRDVHTPLQDRQAEAILKTLIEEADKILGERPDYDSRATWMWCCTQALNGLIACGCVEDWTTHMIGHELTAFFGIDHGQSLAVVMPAVWKHQKQNKKAKLAQYARRIWHVTSGSIDEQADAAIDKTVAFFNSIGVPTRLDDYRINGTDIRKVVERFAQRGTILGENQNIKAKEIEEILRLCL